MKSSPGLSPTLLSKSIKIVQFKIVYSELVVFACFVRRQGIMVDQNESIVYILNSDMKHVKVKHQILFILVLHFNGLMQPGDET